ncbi:MAG TPA: ferritin family protein [Candidatus Cloacimonadota bacterium]|nr:ferritin family protein [Candidatus Cloacimonadota bacterium]HPT71962.1 ferritin family protein [Candidatus Cloacimonadota bacterium]
MLFQDAMLKSLKDGMKAEMDSVILYKAAGETAADREVKQFFEDRMDEEKRHYNYLIEYYHQIEQDEEPSELWDSQSAAHNMISPAISDEFIKRIGENQILFSAISTAVLLEKNAIDFYQKCHDETEIVVLQNFYQMMIKWETIHYEDVLRIQREAEEIYWRMNRFEPF